MQGAASGTALSLQNTGHSVNSYLLICSSIICSSYDCKHGGSESLPLSSEALICLTAFYIPLPFDSSEFLF